MKSCSNYHKKLSKGMPNNVIIKLAILNYMMNVQRKPLS